VQRWKTTRGSPVFVPLTLPVHGHRTPQMPTDKCYVSLTRPPQPLDDQSVVVSEQGAHRLSPSPPLVNAESDAAVAVTATRV